MSAEDVKTEGSDFIWVPLLLAVVGLVVAWVFVGHDVAQWFGVIGTAVNLLIVLWLAAAKHSTKEEA